MNTRQQLTTVSDILKSRSSLIMTDAELVDFYEKNLVPFFNHATSIGTFKCTFTMRDILSVEYTFHQSISHNDFEGSERMSIAGLKSVLKRAGFECFSLDKANELVVMWGDISSRETLTESNTRGLPPPTSYRFVPSGSTIGTTSTGTPIKIDWNTGNSTSSPQVPETQTRQSTSLSESISIAEKAAENLMNGSLSVESSKKILEDLLGSMKEFSPVGKMYSDIFKGVMDSAFDTPPPPPPETNSVQIQRRNDDLSTFLSRNALQRENDKIADILHRNSSTSFAQIQQDNDNINEFLRKGIQDARNKACHSTSNPPSENMTAKSFIDIMNTLPRINEQHDRARTQQKLDDILSLTKNLPHSTKEKFDNMSYEDMKSYVYNNLINSLRDRDSGISSEELVTILQSSPGQLTLPDSVSQAIRDKILDKSLRDVLGMN